MDTSRAEKIEKLYRLTLCGFSNVQAVQVILPFIDYLMVFRR